MNLKNMNVALVLIQTLLLAHGAHVDETEAPRSEADAIKDEADARIEAIKQQVKRYIKPDTFEYFSHLMVNQEVYNNVAFKIVIPKKQEECFYQQSTKYTQLQFSFECITPATFSSPGKLTAYMDYNNGYNDTNLQTLANVRNGMMQWQAEKPGMYGFCLDNTADNTPKTVQINFDYWKLYEISKFHMAAHEDNDPEYHIIDMLFQISKDLARIKTSMVHTRAVSLYDEQTLHSNLDMVNEFSIVSVLLILGVSGLQLYVVKRMFIGPKM